MDAHKNFALSSIATAPSPATSGTTLIVQSGQGSLFATPPFNAVVWPAQTTPTAANAEIVRVTGISTDTFTIVRTQESTSARTIVVGDQIMMTATAKTFTDIENNVTFANAVLNTGVSGTAIDTDSTFAANSDTKLATQKAIKTALAAKGQLIRSAGVDIATRPAINFVSSASVQTSVVDNSGTSAVDITLSIARFAGLVALGHSYTQIGGNSPGNIWENYTHRVAATLNIPADEVYLWGRSGGMANAFTEIGGLPFVYRYITPNHKYNPSDVFHGTSKSWPALFLLMYGYNEQARYFPGWTIFGLPSYIHAMRSGIAHLRAARLYTSSDTVSGTRGGWNFTGTWTTPTTDDFHSGPSWKKTVVNTSVGEFTIPSDFEGGTIGIRLIASPQIGLYLVNSMAANAAGTSENVEVYDFFGTNGHLALRAGDVLVDTAGGKTEKLLVNSIVASATAGRITMNVTRGHLSTTGETHSAVAFFKLATDGVKVTWSTDSVDSTVASVITGTTNLSGQGSSGMSAITATTINETSASGQTTIDVASSTAMQLLYPLGGTAYVVTAAGFSSFTFTGYGTNQLTGCSGAPAIVTGQPIWVGNVVDSRAGVHVTQRFTLPAIAAGKKIIATVSGIMGNEYAGVDSAVLEDDDPPIILMINQPEQNPPGFGPSVAVAAQLNTAMSDLATEFGSSVKVVDINTRFNERWKLTVMAGTSLGTTNGGGASPDGTMKLTPSDYTKNELSVGSVIRTSAGEEILVQGLTKTSNTEWRIGGTRAYTGVGSAGSSAAATSSAAGTSVHIMAPWCTDRVHPSDEGHQAITGAVLETLGTTAQTSDQIANSGAIIGRRRPRMRDRGSAPSAALTLPGGPIWYPVIRSSGNGTRTTSAVSLNATGDIITFPFEVHEACILRAINFEVTAVAAAGATIKGVVFADGPGRPGYWLGDTSAVAADSIAVKSSTGFINLKPGWIHIGLNLIGTPSTLALRAISTTNSTPPDYPIASTETTNPLGTSATPPFMGWKFTGYTGASPVNGPSLNVESMINGTVPLIYLQFDVIPRSV